ncbi:MAG TPA: polyphosphate kinase 2 family protein [Acidimicrobiales bacterium]|nr:polyphosphate kinase 2 family protein [Acidimicrobiales bacterium]
MAEPFRVHPGHPTDPGAFDPGSTAGAPGDREVTEAAVADLQQHLRDLQDRLWAEARRSVLVVLQGLDAAGKDGTIRHVFTGVNPQGVRVSSFKEPTAQELSHDFLWRIHRDVPRAGEIGIFNRSHYEDVLVARVDTLVADKVWRARFAHINAFESLLTDSGTTLVKFFLHISRDEQGRRLQERLDRPDKRWKLNRTDFVERTHWDAYQAAYADVLSLTSTESAPWYVIPSDHKWFRNWAVSKILVDVLHAMDPRYPDPPPLEGVSVD